METGSNKNIDRSAHRLFPTYDDRYYLITFITDTLTESSHVTNIIGVQRVSNFSNLVN